MEEERRKSNPYGANAVIKDPRQGLFLRYYIDPKSKTFSNAYQSALEAGYSDEYAKTILSQDVDWLSSSIRSQAMLNKAEKNLDSYLDLDEFTDGKLDKDIIKIKTDVSKFTASRLGKEKWSEKSEVKHSGEIKQILTEEQINELIKRRQSNNTSRKV